MVDVDQVSQQAPAVKVKWPLRIGLLVVLLLAWAMGLGLVEEMKGVLHDGYMLGAETKYSSPQSASDVIMWNDAEFRKRVETEAIGEAMRSYVVAVGFIHGTYNLLGGGLAILIWFMTRKRLAPR